MFQHKKDATTDNTAMDVEEDPAVRNLPLCVLSRQLVWQFSTPISPLFFFSAQNNEKDNAPKSVKRTRAGRKKIKRAPKTTTETDDDGNNQTSKAKCLPVTLYIGESDVDIASGNKDDQSVYGDTNMFLFLRYVIACLCQFIRFLHELHEVRLVDCFPFFFVHL